MKGLKQIWERKKQKNMRKKQIRKKAEYKSTVDAHNS